MKISFILPAVGRKRKQNKYLRTWQMEPLAIAQLASLTPKDIAVEFFDDRIEDINYQTDAKLIAINVETYTAKRAYEIAGNFKALGKTIIMGGFHATLIPEEAAEHADAVVIGEAENVWERVLRDFQNGTLEKFYQSKERPSLAGIFPDRSIFHGKNYLKLGLVEAGRGCLYNCDFCSVTNFYRHSYRARPIEDVVQEVKSLRYKYYFFVNDNLCADIPYAKQLFRALIPLKIKWVSQASINIARDEELLSLMQQSGGQGILIGFESLDQSALRAMNKPVVNQVTSYDEAIRKIHRYGLRIYATFVFGYDHQGKEIFDTTYRFVKKHRIMIAAFNHLVPFPGTPLYRRLEQGQRLLYKKWWLEPSYHFGQVAFRPGHMSADSLATLCHEYRRKLYSWPCLLTRLLNFRVHLNSPASLFMFFTVNLLSKIDARKRRGLPLGASGGGVKSSG